MLCKIGTIYYFNGMENSGQEDILNITLSNGGAATLKRVVNSTRVVFFFSCITGILTLLQTYLSFRALSPTAEKDTFFYWYVNIFSIVSVIYTVVFVFQVYQFVKFTRRINQSIAHGDSDSFNRSFNYLQRYNKFGILGLSICVF